MLNAFIKQNIGFVFNLTVLTCINNKYEPTENTLRSIQHKIENYLLLIVILETLKSPTSISIVIMIICFPIRLSRPRVA